MVSHGALTSTDRLVRSPTFILSSVRSGSTLLRVLLNTHSMICAPHELHLRTMQVRFTERFTNLAVQQIGLDQAGLEYLLWDRVLHRELTRSGKQLIVDKTPGNVFAWERLRECWPDARYIILLRHPVSILESIRNDAQGPIAEKKIDMAMTYIRAMETAARDVDGLTIRYEDLVATPAEVTRDVCAFLEVPWEAGMLSYGEQDHGPFLPFIGDWTDKIATGRIQSPRPLPRPDEVPEHLRAACREWGYL